MGLTEEIENLRSQLKDVEAVEEQPQEEEAVQETPPAEEKPQEVAEEEVKKDPEPPKEKVEDEPKDASSYARMRREKAAAEKRARDLEEQLESLKRGQQPADAAPEESEVRHDPELARIIRDRRVADAEREFSSMESQYASVDPNYAPLATSYKIAVYQSVKLENPDLDHQQILDATREKVLMMAAKDVAAGRDPIIELYERAKKLGLKPYEEPKAVAEPVKEPLKPDLDVVAKNRARNAGTAAARGAADGGQLTREGASQLTSAEWAKLPVSERQRLMRGG